MPIASVVKPKISKQKIIQPNTLLEELYTFYSLSQLQAMLESEPDKLHLKNWNVSHDVLHEDLKLAIEFVNND